MVLSSTRESSSQVNQRGESEAAGKHLPRPTKLATLDGLVRCTLIRVGETMKNTLLSYFRFSGDTAQSEVRCENNDKGMQVCTAECISTRDQHDVTCDAGDITSC